MQRAWQRAYNQGETDAAPQRGGQTLHRKMQRVFLMDFISEDCEHSLNGQITICRKIDLLVGKYLYIIVKKHEDAWRLKLGLDYEGDSLEVLMQILFNDDPLKTHKFDEVKKDDRDHETEID